METLPKHIAIFKGKQIRKTIFGKGRYKLYPPLVGSGFDPEPECIMVQGQTLNQPQRAYRRSV
jgi:hypothetical protein